MGRIILIAVSAIGWYWLLHVQLTLPASVVLGLVGWAALMTVIALVQRQRAREARKEVNAMGQTDPNEDQWMDPSTFHPDDLREPVVHASDEYAVKTRSQTTGAMRGGNVRRRHEQHEKRGKGRR